MKHRENRQKLRKYVQYGLALAAITVTAICVQATRGQDLMADLAQNNPIGPTGGSVPFLNFAIVGDTRPSKNNDTKGYPTSVITQIYQDVEQLSPHPDFVLTTGDYMFNTPGRGQAAPQASKYVQAAQNYTGQIFPSLGNHECTGWTKSDCGPNGSDGISENYTVFMQDILQGFGIQSQVPYYVIHVNSSDPTNPWTAKFVFAAPNAWDDTQAAWLDSAMSEKTTFTFVIKHEPDYDDRECVGCGASDRIVKQYPVTMYIYGHTHTYTFTAPNSLVVGNGGAPLDGPSDQFGYVACHQQKDNSINCQEFDYNANTSSYANSNVTVSPTGELLQ